jgi:hypothetical protein
VGAGGNSSQCFTVATPTGSPILHLDQLAGTDLGVISIRGWAVDPDTVGGIRVHIYVDGVLATKVTADTAKAGIGTAFPGYGDSHSFSTTIAGITPGSHSVCVYAINAGGGGTTAYCQNTPAVTGSPVLLLDQVAAQGANSVLIRGWAIDPDSLDPQRIHIYVDDVLSTKVTADMPKASLATAYPPFGANHAFSVTIAAVTTGVHQVCIYAINVGAGGNTKLCQSVTVT